MKSTPDILLVYPPVMLDFNPTDPPYGLMYLAATLRNAKVSVEILDLNALRWSDDEVRAYFRENRFPIIGIGGMSTIYYYAKWLSHYIREVAPETKLIGGGSFATSCPEIVLQHTALDAICQGEGEGLIVDLVKALQSGADLSPIDGVSFRDADGAVVQNPERKRIPNLDVLPYPAYDLVDMKLYLANSGKRPALLRRVAARGISEDAITNTFIMFSSRGCPFTCSFCYRNFGKKMTRHSVDYMIGHIKYVRNILGVNNIAFYDETFNSSRKWMLEFCRQAREELPDTYFWIGGARVDLLDEELLKELRDASFYEISVGVESFDNRILKEMSKSFTSEKLTETLKLLQQYEMAPSCLGLLYGFPGDDEESLQISEDAIIRLGIPAYFQFPLPFPGTLLFDQIQEEDPPRIADVEKFLASMADQMTQDLFINLSRFPDKELVAMVRATEARIAAALAPATEAAQQKGTGIRPDPATRILRRIKKVAKRLLVAKEA